MVSNEPGMGKELVLSGLMMCSALVMNHESLNVLETQLVSMTATMRKMLESLVPHVNSHLIFLPVTAILVYKMCTMQYVMMET